MSTKLYRSRENRMIAGVCGGLGEYFQIDPVLIRVLFVVATFGGGIGFLGYIVLWIVIPEKPQPAAEGAENILSPPVQTTAPSQEQGGKAGGFILIALGIIFFINNFAPHWNIWQYWPLVLVGFGVWLLKRSSNNS